MEPVELPSVDVYPPGQQPPEPVSLPTPATETLPLPVDVATQRATKAAAGLGDILGKSADDLTPDFIAGKENLIRQEAAAALDYQNNQSKQDQLTQLAQKYGPLNSEQVMQILDPWGQRTTDPSSVIERAYSNSYVGALATAPGFLGDTSALTLAQQLIPDQAKQALDDSGDLAAKNQYLLTKIQDAETRLAGQSWIGWGADMLKGMTQVYPELKQRGLVDGIWSGLGLGESKEQQSTALYRKPFGDFKAVVDAIDQKLGADNPGLAVSFLHDMYGQNDFERALDNVFTAMAIPDAKLGMNVIKKVLTYNEIRKGARDMASAASLDPSASPVNMMAAAGDTHESAVLQVANNVVKAIDGGADPTQTAKQTLMTTWKTVADQFGENPGTKMSREELTRIQDGITKDGAALIDRIMTMNRVERVPLAVASKDVINAYKDHLAEGYRGSGNMVGDIDGPFIEPASNTKWFRAKLLDYDASLFSDRDTAEGRLTNTPGLVRGTAPDTLYIPEAAAKNLESVKTTETGTKFFVDHGIEVQSSPSPQPGFVPYNTKTGKFGPTLTEATSSVQQQGLGFYIEHWTPMKETDDFLRDLMLKDTKGNLVPETVSSSTASGTKGIINSVLGWVRNSDEQLSIQHSIQRKAATYAKSNIEKWAKDLNNDINKVKFKGSWWKPTAYLGKVTGKDVSSQFERALDYGRQTETFFKGPGELQDFYLRSFNRSPSYLETNAYFNYVKLIEGDRTFGEIAEFRNRARVGAEQHRIKFIGPDGKPVYSGLFDGVQLAHLPSNTDQILIAGNDRDSMQVKETGRMDKKSKDKINDMVRQGQGRLIEVYDIDHHPLSDFADVAKDQRIRYVFSKDVESTPIQFNHVNRKEGGHFDWDYDHYIKQADIRTQKSGTQIYVGDRTIMPIKNKSLGNDVVKTWNEARELGAAGKWEEARPLVAKLGIKFQDFTGWYKAGRDEAGRPVLPKLNINEPVYVVPKNKTINDLDSTLKNRPNFHDGTRTGYANNFKVAYNTERHSDYNFRTINDIGTKEDPLYAYQPANMVDPLTTMNRALNRSINSAFMDDYKLYAIEHWLREAEPFLDAKGGKSAIRSAPFWHFNNPEYGSAVPKTTIWNLEANRHKINSFIGIPSKFDTWVHEFTEHLADVAYGKYGPEEGRNIFDKAKSIPPIWLLHRVKNPIDFIRGVTFNFKLGLLSPAQFLVQAQTHALIWSLEPQHGTAGTYAMLLHGWSRINQNPAILDSLDNYATKLSGFGSRFKPGEFLEGMRELEKTGFEHVAGEYSNIAKTYGPTTNFNEGVWDKGLKLGQTPFRLGEQSTRVTAWYTAFRKFRELNPTTPIGNTERSAILNHADMLTVNMSRASSSIINNGVFSLSTQFLSYQIKLAELFWSKRIDNMARARMVIGFSMLYGLPSAVGVTGAPISDNIRTHLIDDLGYIPGEKWLSTMVNEGFPAWGLAMITGKGDLQAGNIENFGDRLGSQGWSNIKQAMRSNVPWWQALGGASVSTMSNFMGAAIDPFYQGAMSWYRGDTGDTRFTVKSADLVEPLKQISSVSLGAKWWTAMKTAQWRSTNESYVTDVTPLRATLLALTGMSPQEQDDMFIKNQIVQGEKDAFKAAQKEAVKDWRRGLEAFENKDPNQGNAYINNAMARLTAVGFPPDEILKFMATANRGWESAIDSSDYSYWSQGDNNKQQQRLDVYKRQLNLNEKRKVQ